MKFGLFYEIRVPMSAIRRRWSVDVRRFHLRGRPGPALVPCTAALLFGAVLAACASPQPAARAPSKPPPAAVTTTRAPAAQPERVVLVTIDTLRADYVGCYGGPARTPTLDRMAAQGVRFDTAISPTPITMPAHATVMTGLDPPQHGVHTNAKFRLEDGIPTLAEQFQASGFATGAFIGSMVLDGRFGLSRGFDVYDDKMGFRRNIHGATGGYAERRANDVVDAALAWLENAPDRFFLWVHFYDPHGNYDPPSGFRPPRTAPADPKALDLAAFVREAFPPLYAGEIYFADTELGRLMRVIDRRWNDDRTLFVVTSDHGESLGDHEEITHTLTLYDATQKVPLLMRGPGIPRGRVVDAQVRLADIAPTILGISGLPPIAQTAGKDLQPWIRGERADALPAYVQTLETKLAYGWSPVWGLRTDHYKYLRTVQPELYDLSRDRLELRNVSGDHPEEVAALDAQLSDRLTGARPVAPNATATPQEAALLESLGYVVRDTSNVNEPVGWVGGQDPKDAIPIFNRLLEARSMLASGDAAGAREALADVEEAGGWIALARAEIANALGDYTDAEKFASEMIAGQPDQAEGYLALGAALEGQGRAADAKAAYEQAVRINPNETDGFVSLGRLAEARGNPVEAEARYREALDSNAPNADAALRLAALYLEQGQTRRADETLAAIQGAGGRPESVIRLARVEIETNRRQAARERVADALSLAPGDAQLTALYEELGGAQAGR